MTRQEPYLHCDGLDHLRLISYDLEGLTGPDRHMDERIVRAVLPCLREAAPHCPGDQPIFWDEPLRKQPVPRVTELIDAVLRIVELYDERQDVGRRPVLGSDFVAQAASCLSASGARGQPLGPRLARILCHNLVELLLARGLDQKTAGLGRQSSSEAAHV